MLCFLVSTVCCHYSIEVFNNETCGNGGLFTDSGDEFVRFSGKMLGYEKESIAITCKENIGEIHICKDITDVKCVDVLKCPVGDCCFGNVGIYYSFSQCSNAISKVITISSHYAILFLAMIFSIL